MQRRSAPQDPRARRKATRRECEGHFVTSPSIPRDVQQPGTALRQSFGQFWQIVNAILCLSRTLSNAAPPIVAISQRMASLRNSALACRSIQQFFAYWRQTESQAAFLHFGFTINLCHNDRALGDEVTHRTAATGGRRLATGQALRMANTTSNGITRRGLLGVFAATAVVAAPTYSNAFGLLRGAGDIRRVRMYSGRTGESIDTIYWIEGEYIPEVMKEINHFMRDWRIGRRRQDGPAQRRHHRGHAPAAGCERTLHAAVGLSQPGDQRDAAVAIRRCGQELAAHEGPGGRSAAEVALGRRRWPRAAEACSAGGVGHYYRSNFVHMDCGPVRTWGG